MTFRPCLASGVRGACNDVLPLHCRQVFIPFSQMFHKEKQVLEELNQHLGTQLQPLSRGLFSKDT